MSIMNKKLLYLIIALVLPSSIFVLLKLTGKNQFDIPVYYSTGIDSLSSICGKDYSKPYLLDDSVLSKLKWAEKECSLFVLAGANQLEMNRLSGIFDAKEFATYSVAKLQLDSITSWKWKNCVFIAKEKINIVLVDKQKQIRGYYTIGSREEMDRLIVEMKILLKKY
jgi:hypothetical protein